MGSRLFSPFQKLVLILCLCAVFLLACYAMRNLLLPFFLAFVLSYLLTPLVDRMEFLLKNRLAAVLFLYTLITTGFVFIFVFMVPILSQETLELSDQFPFYIENIKELLLTSQVRLELEFPFIQRFKFVDTLQAQGQELLFNLAKSLPNLFLSIVSLLTYLSLVPLILFFFLLQSYEMKKSLLEIVPNRYFEMVVYLQFKVGSKLGNYLRGILIETGIIGCVSGFLLLLVGCDYALILGATAGCLNIIPYVGPVIGAIPAIIIFYLQMGTGQSILVVCGIFVLVQVLDNALLKPIIYSQSVDLHPLIVLVALIVGGMYAGVWGLVLAVPVTGVIKVVTTHVYREVQFRLHQT